MAIVDQIKNDPIPKELAFSPEEYAAPVAHVQANMAKQSLDLIITSLRPNLGYRTGYDTSLASAYAIGLVAAEGAVWIHCVE